jgi:hypothetical protein
MKKTSGENGADGKTWAHSLMAWRRWQNMSAPQSGRGSAGIVIKQRLAALGGASDSLGGIGVGLAAQAEAAA